MEYGRDQYRGANEVVDCLKCAQNMEIRNNVSLFNNVVDCRILQLYDCHRECVYNFFKCTLQVVPIDQDITCNIKELKDLRREESMLFDNPRVVLSGHVHDLTEKHRFEIVSICPAQGQTVAELYAEIMTMICPE